MSPLAVRRLLLAALVLVAVSAVAAAPAAARSDNRAKVIVFVHGYENSDNRNNCERTWGNGDSTSSYGDMLTALRGWGWANTFHPVQYYVNDTTCRSRGTLADGRAAVQNVNVSGYKSHSAYYSSGHSGSGHTRETDIRHLAYHWAWAMYYKFTQHDRTVDVVAHSMGGLIVRFALMRVQQRSASFPPRLLVEDVTTLGTPHDGGGGVTRAVGCWSFQCNQIAPGSAFIASLNNAEGNNPQGAGGTDWTTVGAGDDNTVEWTSAGEGLNNARHKVKYKARRWLEDRDSIEHGEYMHRTQSVHDAHARHSHAGSAWTDTTAFPWPVRLTDYALAYGGW